jgi:chromosome partitioning protein
LDDPLGQVALQREECVAMPTVISIANMKGGVGKTTVCVNLAFTLFSMLSKRVLVVDNDPQFNATTALMKAQYYMTECLKDEKYLTIYNIYEKPPRVGRVPKKNVDPARFFIKRWHMIMDPSISLDLIASRLELYETLRNPAQKEYLLDKFLKKSAQKYDYIFIDCPPTPSVLTLSAFSASDYVIIPVTLDYFASFGLPQFMGTLNDFKADLIDSHDVQVLGVVFINVPRKPTPETKRAIEQISITLNELGQSVNVFESRLSHLKVFEKALWQSNPVQEISGRGVRGKSEATRELRALATELEDRIGN